MHCLHACVPLNAVLRIAATIFKPEVENGIKKAIAAVHMMASIQLL